MATVTALPAFLEHFVDDAAIFPPGNVPLEQAVIEHREHLASAYAGLVGGFVVSDVKLPDLLEVVSTPLAINLVVTGGAGAIEPAVRWATRSPALSLRALEFALRDEEDLAHNAQRVIAAVDSLEDDLSGVELYVEPPRLHGGPGHGWLAALDELAAREIRLKFRTGGVTADAFPTAAEVAACIDAALDRELPFKCTAGLHNAVRHMNRTDFERPVEMHGFLNILLATRATLDGDDPVEVLTATDLTERLDAADFDLLASTRKWFTSFGSCSVLEPHEDLVELGLVSP
ncbi:MAG: hypothetical protein JWR35_3384 [Marmoricola sp.]|nr:hypothetical protein [Marmoricola sp.]